MVSGRSLWLLLLALAGSLVAGPVRAAWLEKSVRSDSVIVDLERDGSAVVSHELLLSVRGSPLRDFAVEPVDADAEPLPDATATLAKSGQSAGLPVPLTVTKEGARLSFRIDFEKGLRSGTYQIRFSYRTHLGLAGRLVPTGPETVVEWRGPTFAQGIDSARVAFRIPKAPRPPRLRTAEGEPHATDIAADTDGVFLGTLRRGSEDDEIEVVRPHVAKGESVSWRVVVDSAAFNLAPPRAEGQKEQAVPPLVTRPVKVRRSGFPFGAAAAAGIGSLLYALLVVAKSRGVMRSLAKHRASPRPFLPLGVAARAGVAAMGVLAATAIVVLSAPPLLGALALLVSLAAATHLPPRIAPPLRGPGKWIRLEADLLADERSTRATGPERFLDGGHLLGFVLFISGLMAFVAAAVTTFPRSPYLAFALALSSSLLFPVFFTGREGDLPLDAARAPRPLIEWLSRELAKKGLHAHPIGRFPDGAVAHDELRLLVVPARPVPGFVAIEVGMDTQVGALGALSQPFAIVRVTDGSPAAEALPRGLFWSRGRSGDERVAVLRPRLPTFRVTRDLVRDLVSRLTGPAEARRPTGPARPAQPAQSAQPARSSARSDGRDDSTRNPGSTSSPAHAT